MTLFDSGKLLRKIAAVCTLTMPDERKEDYLSLITIMISEIAS